MIAIHRYKCKWDSKQNFKVAIDLGMLKTLHPDLEKSYIRREFENNGLAYEDFELKRIDYLDPETGDIIRSEV